MESKGSAGASFTCADDSDSKKRGLYHRFWFCILEGVIMANNNVYQVKVRVKNTDPRVKMSPPFLSGVVFAKTPAAAEEKAIKNMTEWQSKTGKTDVIFEKYKVKKLPNSFVYA